MRKNVLWCVLAGTVGALLVSTPALAHHGAASLYDMTKETTLISDELRFRERFLQQPAGIPIRR